ncbi:MAG: helicase, partial [Planctomycetota bacterium]
MSDEDESSTADEPRLDVHAILGRDGRIKRRLKNYEAREQQLAMADAVAKALSDQEHLVVEAGTGTGKSFAYLVPAILHATANQIEDGDDQITEGSDDEALDIVRSRSQEKGSTKQSDAPGQTPKSSHRRVVISTHTISLQEQLIGKDLPLLNSVIPREFSAVLVKGRGNYISLRRLDRAMSQSVS